MPLGKVADARMSWAKDLLVYTVSGAATAMLAGATLGAVGGWPPTGPLRRLGVPVVLLVALLAVCRELGWVRLPLPQPVLGLQRPAHAQSGPGPLTVTYACCNLCYYPGSPPCRLARCGWSWTCCYPGKLYRCLERYDGQPCSGCESTICSQATVIGSC